ncbi:WD40-repeat-containing domain protein [Globomyces pollinis-pini]|nr:WD40-repeat-containing domain protein [Globomyces pollinis-pini]
MKSLTVKSDDEDDDDDDDDSEDDNRVDELPIKSFCSLVDHHKTVCCFSVDRANSRFITGGRDNTVKMWDFHGMSSVMKPFKSMEPEEGNPIRDIQFSNSGDSFLVAPSCWQPILYDKDGNEVHKFLKGDPYLRDFRHIKGHIAALTSLQWHPNDNSLFLTSSLDSTVRVWDVMDKKSSRNALFVRPKGNVGKDPITSAVFSHDGRNILAGDSAGHIRVWNSTTTTSIPLLTIDKAHMAGNPITCVQYSLNGHHIFSRSLDDTLKLWDLRNSKKSIGEANNVVSFHEEANAIYSPNERYILCGTSVKKDAGPGKVLVFDSKTLEKVVEFETATSCIRLLWPKKMNQIFAGLGNGDVQVLYDPDLSVGGVMVPLSKKPRKLAVDDYDIYM